MRKLIISMLLASAVASPALAQDRDHARFEVSDDSARAEHRAERQQARQEQQQARQEQARPERPAPQFEQRQQQFEQRQQRFEQRQQSGDQGRGDWARSHFDGQTNTAPQQVVEQQQQVQRDDRRDRGGFSGRDQQSRDGGWTRDRNWTRDRDGDSLQRQVIEQQQQQQWRNSNRWAGNNTRWSGNWNRDWRNDRRYDWRRYRDNHRSTFRIGIYFDPFGYNYRPYSIGYRLSPAYLGQRYWIDPQMYQLPYPPPGTMWVRYWNDALLVDMYSGEVIDVIRDFFW